jgi:hypothetical protein
MTWIDSVIDKIFPSIDYLESRKKPWLKRDYTEETPFIIPVEYLLEHLDLPDLVKIKGKQTQWQEKKKEAIRQKLDSGTTPDQMPPILLTLHLKKHEFRVRDGISRIGVFHERQIPAIKAVVMVGRW